MMLKRKCNCPPPLTDGREWILPLTDGREWIFNREGWTIHCATCHGRSRWRRSKR